MPENYYLIRFDDICPTMNWSTWEAIEALLIKHRVRPILAVVPDNCDPALEIDPPNPDFWERVRQWQSRGYTIALHGHQHVYVNTNPGLMRLTPQSEFAGLPYADQKRKLRLALDIFSQNGVRAEAWVAPSHSFDRTTVAVLKELGVRVISDGLWPWPHADRAGITWVPQQLWNFLDKSEGVWTVCCHHNNWDERKLQEFESHLETYSSRISDVSTILTRYTGRKMTFNDTMAAAMDWAWNHRFHDLRAHAYRVLAKFRRASGGLS
jgi:Uncharacterized protein conserved in bacteria (DUF2334)